MTASEQKHIKPFISFSTSEEKERERKQNTHRIQVCLLCIQAVFDVIHKYAR